MNKFLTAVLSTATLFASLVSNAEESKLQSNYDQSINQKAIRTVSDAVWDWQVKTYTATDWNGNAVRGWVHGVLFNGMDDWAATVDDDKYFDVLKNIFNRQSWQVGNRMYHADDICVAQSYLNLYARFGEEKMLIPSKARMDWVIANPPKENIDITKGASDRWWWCDALYMAPGAYAHMTKITGDKKYMKFAHQEYLACYEHLYSTADDLFYRDAKYFTKKEANGAKVFWSRGNGWVMGSIPEVLKSLPKNDKKYRPFYEELLVKMARRLVKLQDENGYWHSGLLDIESYPHPETSGTGLITYALAYGVNEGILSKEEFMPAITKGWEALVAAVTPDGMLGWVQTISAQPNKVDKESTQLYGVGGFLMTASELYRMK